MLIDLSYPGFLREFAALGSSHPALRDHFKNCVASGAVISSARISFVEAAFDGTYTIHKLSYQDGQLEMLARCQDGVYGFTAIIKPRLPSPI